MSGTVQCFWVEPSEFVRVRLRRYRYTAVQPCVAAASNSLQCCDASVVIHYRALRSAWVEDLANGCERHRQELVSNDSPQWPLRCDACGIPFEGDSVKQVWAETLYVGAPDGRPYVERELPVGAMWHCRWWGAETPDGISLKVMLPDRTDWLVDDGRWTRIGDPRAGTVSVVPSIRSPRYHGYLTNGKLEPQSDSAT